ncbi:UDP-N-acetylglucosamine 2-epimerase [uncultured Prevotella sp.]|uniref:UDP-N-acetyl glucosamine 2-epimerase n=1 Tax=uncultured Prevotella sp. TaxID=159272 RepID=UPI002594978B|nr:UDP-N-acetylglucosamine 2-epimerase [uncultured Prevotella sp.]
MEIAIFCGARPNFIKVAPVIRQITNLQKRGEALTYTLIYAGAEDDPTIEGTIFDDLDIQRPGVYLSVTCQNLNELTGQVMAKFEAYLQGHHTDAVIVVDDLASTMAAAIVTKKQGILLAHIAAGTRSFDIKMPKEINRLVIDGLSDLLFTAGISNNSIANREGAELSKVYCVGNILTDNLRHSHNAIEAAGAETSRDVLEPLGLVTSDGNDSGAKPRYIVFTLNRKALLADRDNLLAMLTGMLKACGDTLVIAPLRNPAVETITSLGLHRGLDLHNFHIVNPLGYLPFSYLTKHALGIITDSGNVAEEATFNQVPCITLNSYTEHIETVKVGTNVLVGEDADKLAEATRKMVSGEWKQSAIPERWDGRVAERIVQTVVDTAGKYYHK